MSHTEEKPTPPASSIEEIKSSEAEDAYRNRLFPCILPCDCFGVCDGCCERLVYGAGYERGLQAGKRLEMDWWAAQNARVSKLLNEKESQLAAAMEELRQEELVHNDIYDVAIKERDAAHAENGRLRELVKMAEVALVFYANRGGPSDTHERKGCWILRERFHYSQATPRDLESLPIGESKTPYWVAGKVAREALALLKEGTK